MIHVGVVKIHNRATELSLTPAYQHLGPGRGRMEAYCVHLISRRGPERGTIDMPKRWDRLFPLPNA